jgi:formamidopyrimidine-DNA glycosylase
MLELPEIATIRNQMNNALPNKTVKAVDMMDRKIFAGTIRRSLITQERSAFVKGLVGSTVSHITSRGNSIYIHFQNRAALSAGAIYGNILLTEPGDKLPKKPTICISFVDGCTLSIVVNLFGQIRIFRGLDSETKSNRPYSLDPGAKGFTWQAFSKGLKEWTGVTKYTCKKLITSCSPEYLIGIGNGYASEILYRARIHPKKKLGILSMEEKKAFFSSIKSTINEAIRLGGRISEKDLYGNPGKFTPTAGRDMLGELCPQCKDQTIKKLALEGGASYFCPSCQVP